MHGRYRLKTGFYGLTDMPVTIQKLMGYTLAGLENTRFFFDDIISRGSFKINLSMKKNR